jgi:branched-subunit amino acid aminotransferase/4-amino-4-deoxychorismate lyase
MTEDVQFFCFRDSALELVTQGQQTEVQLEVADSWLVEDGRARSIDAHFERFARWVGEVSPDCTPSLPSFFSAVKAMIPQEGRWFPRIEFHAEAEAPNHLFLRLRKAPAQLGVIALWTLPEPDPRQNPTVKGPDLSLGMQMRRNAKMHGADEAVILDSAGFVLEGALSALVWWRGDVLCSSSDDLPWLPSVTRQEIFAVAEQMGHKTRTERVRPADLVGLEIWALSSLQGIRVVSDWIGLGGPVGKPTHFDAYSKRLRMLTTAIQ